MAILMAKVARLILAFSWNSSEARSMLETTWMILVLLNTEFTSVTRLSTANPIALPVSRAPAKQRMTKTWWTSSLLGCLCHTMSTASATWTPMEKATKDSAEVDDVSIRSLLISGLAYRAATAQSPVMAAAILAMNVFCHFHNLDSEERTEAGGWGRRTRPPRKWRRRPTRSQSAGDEEKVDSWSRKEERRSWGPCILSSRKLAVSCSSADACRN